MPMYRAPRLCVLALLALRLLSGQTSTSQLAGTVTDSTGAVVPGANVSVANEATGIRFQQRTTAAGLYAFPALPVGLYSVTVEMQGFKTVTKTGSKLEVNTPLTLDFVLSLGETTEVVKVEAASEALQTSNATIGNVVERKAIVNLPLNGRNPLTLLTLEPGVVQRSGNTVNVNGARAAAVNVTIDGIEANESSNPNPTNNIFRLNPDNVQEFKVTTSNPTPEEGRNSGANVSIATRSGTNEFHGTVFEFLRNTAFNSQEFFAKAQGQPKPDLKLNQYGFEVGGPIFKNRTFFFGSWQGQQVNFRDPVDKAFGESVDLYTSVALTGLYRYFVVDPRNPYTVNGVRITQNSPVLIDQRTGALAPGVRTCSGTGDTNCVATYNIFANDPRGIGLDKTVGALLRSYPAANAYTAGDGLNTANYIWNTPSQIRGPHYLARIDHTINDRNTLWGRYLGAEQNTLGGDPLNGRPQIFPGFPTRGEVFRPAKNIAVGWRSVISPRVVNELTLGYSRFKFLFTQGEANPAFPNIPAFTFGNTDVDYTNTPRTVRALNTPQLIENLSVVSGSHVFRFGGNLRFYQHNDQRGDLGGVTVTPAISLSRTTRPPAGFTNLPALTNATTGVAGISANDNNRLLSTINDLLGIPAQISQNYLGDLRSDAFLPFRSGSGVTLWAQGQRLKQYNFYAQDEWRFRRNITINYGVRWEINPAPTEAGGRVYVPDRAIDGRDGDVTFVKADHWFNRNNANAFAPRLGLTWSPGSSGKTVIRTGYGMAFDTLSSFQVTAVAVRVPGQTFRCSVTLSDTGNPTITPGCSNANVPNIRLGEGFPSELPLPTAKPSSLLKPDQQIYSNASNVTVFDPNLKVPTVHQWNFMVQRELPGSIVASVAYVGRRGTRLFRTYDANQVESRPILDSFLAMQRNSLISGCRPDGTLTNGTACPGAASVPLANALLGAGQTAAQVTSFLNSTATLTDLAQNAAGNFAGRLDQISVPVSRAVRVRPNLQFQRITAIDNGGDSNYHSLQATARRRFDSAGLLLAAAYTLGKSIDNQSLDPVGSTTGGGLGTTAVRTPVDSRNFGLERARSDFDQRHVVTVTGLYELPFGRGKRFASGVPGWANQIIGGWSTNTIYVYQSGEPFSVRSGVLTANFSAQSRAGLVDYGRYPDAQLQEVPGVIGPVLFKDASAFTIPGPGQVGIGRNVFQGPSFWNVDTAVTKSFAFTERVKMLFRTELFNALNHPSFRNPRDASVGSPSIISPVFAQTCCVTLSTASSASVNQNGESWRVIQFALKLQF